MANITTYSKKLSTRLNYQSNLLHNFTTSKVNLFIPYNWRDNFSKKKSKHARQKKIKVEKEIKMLLTPPPEHLFFTFLPHPLILFHLRPLQLNNFINFMFILTQLSPPISYSVSLLFHSTKGSLNS